MEDGFNDGDRLEVSLVHRDGLANTAAIFFADIRGAGTRGNRRFLNVWHEEGIKETIYLDAYFLLSITWTPDRMAPMDPVSVQSSQEAQSEGYEVICHILEQAGIEEECHAEKEPEVKMTRIGPRRVEVKLVQKIKVYAPIEVIVLEYHPPKGPFKHHTIKGRPWNEATKRLETTVKTYHSDSWWISNVVKHLSAGTSTSSFHGEQDEASWQRVDEFLKKMHTSEINVLRHFKWRQTAEGDEEEEFPTGRWSRNRHNRSHNTGHYRNPYEPAAVFFRVSGDDIGKKAFLVQAEKQVKDCPDPPTLKEFLEEAEKKAVAGDESGSEETSSALSDGLPDVSGEPGDSTNVVDVGDAGDSSRDATGSDLPAHDSELDNLEDDIGIAFGAVPYIPGLSGASYSAIERSLRHALRGVNSLDHLTGKRRKRTLH